MSGGAGPIVILCSVTMGFDFAHNLAFEFEHRLVYHILVFQYLNNILGRSDLRLQRGSALVGEEDACMMFARDTGSRDMFVDCRHVV